MYRLVKPYMLVVGVVLMFQHCTQKVATSGPTPKVEVVLPIVDSIAIKKDFVGQIYGAKDIPIRARVDGFLNEIMFREGSMVYKNQLLYIIDPLPSDQEVSASRSSYEEARAALVQAQNDLERIRPLAEINAVSQSDLDAAIANKQAASKRVDAAKANLNLSEINRGYTELRAPINGVIGKTGAEIGEYVGGSMNTLVLNTVSRIDTVRVEFFLTEEDYLEIWRELIAERKEQGKSEISRRSDPVNLELLLADGSLFDEPGRIKFLDRGVDPSTGTILIQAEFPNPDRLLKPGQFAKVRVTMETRPEAILIPYRCLIQTQGINTIKVVDESGMVSVRSVQVGVAQRDMIEVISGLTADEKIVLTGLQLARDGAKVEAELVEFKSQASI